MSEGDRAWIFPSTLFTFTHFTMPSAECRPRPAGFERFSITSSSVFDVMGYTRVMFAS